MLDRGLLLAMLLFLLACTSGHVGKNQPPASVPDSFFEIREKIVLDTAVLHRGDLILKCGYGPISKMIVDKLHEAIPISHCAVLDTINGRWMVIHSLALEAGGGTDGVQRMPLSDFLPDTRPGSLFLLRHKGSRERTAMIAANARRYLSERRPFDYDFDLSDTNKFYCSELVYRCLVNTYRESYFDTVGVGLRQVLTFNSLLTDTAHFTIIDANPVTR